jgi:hypothetical protein
MKVPLAVLADYANVTKEGKLNIMGIFDVLHAASFPVEHSQMQLVMKFQADVAESGKTKDIEIQLMDADGKRLFTVGGQLTMTQVKPGEVMELNSIFKMHRVRFESEGNYEFKILIQGNVVRSVPLKVVKRQSPS